MIFDDHMWRGRTLRIAIGTMLVFLIIFTGFVTTAYGLNVDVSKSKWGEPTTKFSFDDMSVYLIAHYNNERDTAFKDVIWFRPDGTEEPCPHNNTINTKTTISCSPTEFNFSDNGIVIASSTEMPIKGINRMVGNWRVQYHYLKNYHCPIERVCIGDDSYASANFTILNLSDISYVDDNFTDDPVNHKWNTIQKGIDDVKPGGTVIVYDGNYPENVVVGDRITLKGIGMPVIDAHWSGSPITINSDGATIDGFFIMGSNNSYPNAGISVNSNNNKIINNTVTNNFKGIDIISGTNNTIDSNNISFNRNSELSDGIYIESSNNTIINNYVEGNRDEGIQVYFGTNNYIVGNTVISNGNSNNNTGIYVSDYNNHLYHNNLIDNSINAYDLSSNFWNSSTDGNYWSDYKGIDSNSDGIGDTPYSISGGDNKDNYPFMRLNGWLSVTPPTATTETITSSSTSVAPTIDGVFNSGEWLNKISITLNGYDHPLNIKYGDLYVMNDANNIYVAIVIPDTNKDANYLMLDFDNGNDHIASAGREDAVGFDVANLYGEVHSVILTTTGMAHGGHKIRLYMAQVL